MIDLKMAKQVNLRKDKQKSHHSILKKSGQQQLASSNKPPRPNQQKKESAFLRKQKMASLQSVVSLETEETRPQLVIINTQNNFNMQGKAPLPFTGRNQAGHSRIQNSTDTPSTFLSQQLKQMNTIDVQSQLKIQTTPSHQISRSQTQLQIGDPKTVQTSHSAQRSHKRVSEEGSGADVKVNLDQCQAQSQQQQQFQQQIQQFNNRKSSQVFEYKPLDSIVQQSITESQPIQSERNNHHSSELDPAMPQNQPALAKQAIAQMMKPQTRSTKRRAVHKQQTLDQSAIPPSMADELYLTDANGKHINRIVMISNPHSKSKQLATGQQAYSQSISRVGGVSRGSKLLDGNRNPEGMTCQSASHKRRSGTKVKQIMKENNQNQLLMFDLNSNQVSEFKEGSQPIGPNQLPLSSMPSSQHNVVYINRNGEELINFPLQNPQIINQQVHANSAMPSQYSSTHSITTQGYHQGRSRPKSSIQTAHVQRRNLNNSREMRQGDQMNRQTHVAHTSLQNSNQQQTDYMQMTFQANQATHQNGNQMVRTLNTGLQIDLAQPHSTFGGNSLRITGVTHPQQMNFIGAANVNLSQISNKNGDKNNQTNSNNQRGMNQSGQQFFGKRKHRDRELNRSGTININQQIQQIPTPHDIQAFQQQKSQIQQLKISQSLQKQQSVKHSQIMLDEQYQNVRNNYSSIKSHASKVSEKGQQRPQTSKQKFNQTHQHLRQSYQNQEMGQYVHNGSVVLIPHSYASESGNNMTNIDFHQGRNGLNNAKVASAPRIIEPDSASTIISNSQTGSNNNLHQGRQGLVMSQQNSIDKGTLDPKSNSVKNSQFKQKNDSSKMVSSASPSLQKLGQVKKLGSGMQPQSCNGSSQIPMMPCTPEVFKRTKRISFTRRMNLMDRPLIIIEFQGVLGDFIKKPNLGLRDIGLRKVDKKDNQFDQASIFGGLQLRAGVIDGLKYLSKFFQLVIFSRETIEETWFTKQGGQIPNIEEQNKHIKSFFSTYSDIKLDAFYSTKATPKQQTITDDYSQIFIDFGLDSESKVKERVLFINSIENDFLCNSRVVQVSDQKNSSPRGKGIERQIMRISNDIDKHGFFLFDFSCQPPVPLVKGLPITLDMKQHHKKKENTRSNSLLEDSEMKDSQQSPIEETITREMPTTLLVPNVRVQSAKFSTSFNQVVKTIMMLGLLGQKRQAGKSLLREMHGKEMFSLDQCRDQIDKTMDRIKEQNVKLTPKSMIITPTNHPKCESTINVAEIKASNGENHSPLSNKSGGIDSNWSNQNGRSVRKFKVNQASSFNLRIQNTKSSRTAATNYSNGFEQTNSSDQSNKATNYTNKESSFQQRSQSFGSDKFEKSHANGSLNAQETKTQCGTPLACEKQVQPKELAFDLQDHSFFINLSWSQGADALNQSDEQGEKKLFLGMQSIHSDIIWRYYKKAALDRIKLRRLHEDRMSKLDHLVNYCLTNERLVKIRKENIDQIFKLFKISDFNGNPFGLTMARNYKFFINLNVNTRIQLREELHKFKAQMSQSVAPVVSRQSQQNCIPPSTQEQPKMRNKSQQAKGSKSEPSSTTAAANAVEESKDKSAEEQAKQRAMFKEQQERYLELLSKQHQRMEEILDRNCLMNRVVLVGLEALSTRNMQLPM